MGRVRTAARAVGWLFVAAIAVHGCEAAGAAYRAIGDHHWRRALAQGSLALVVAVLVAGAVAYAVTARRRGRT